MLSSVFWRKIFSPIRQRQYLILLVIVSLLISIAIFTNAWNFEVLSVKRSGFSSERLDEKIDWNDYEIIKNDALRSGFGEHGKGETLSDPEEIKRNDELFKTFGMSVVISDKISVNRSIPDFRHPDCMMKKYLRHLPRVSIVIIFNNEIFSVFKRTLHSLYNRTPHELIEEVILVNDNSELDYLYDQLREYISENFKALVFRIINLNQRAGAMGSRVVGVKAAKSEYVFVMEPHCEMTYNWLPPLIEPVLLDPKTVTVPIIDNVEYTHINYYENDRGNKGCRGVFNWDLEYEKLARFPIERDKMLDPFPTPIMTGGIFLMRKDYFFEIGPYDEKNLIWGAEAIDMSFRIHCGGKLLEVPCSRIGHVFRAFNKFRRHDKGIDFLHFNNKRVVEVWFDDHKDIVYKRKSKLYKSLNVGDLTDAKNFRKKLNCKPFKYFLDVLAPDLVENFPIIEMSFAYGTVRLSNTSLCLDTFTRKKGEKLGLYPCDEDAVEPRSTQNFELSYYRDFRIRLSNICLDSYESSTAGCHKQQGNQLVRYNMMSQQIFFINARQCIEGDPANRANVTLQDCNFQNPHQRWSWGFVNQTAMNDWEHSGIKLTK